MSEINLIDYTLYSSNEFLVEDKESCQENQERMRDPAILDSLSSPFGQEYNPWIVRSLKGREVEHLQSSPLINFKEKLSEISEEPNFGVHYNGVGKGLVKGANLAFRKIQVKEQEMTELDFKINHVFREKIQHLIDDLSQRDLDVMTSLLSQTGSHGKRVLLEKTELLPLGNSNMGSAVKVSLEGLGSIFIGSAPNLPGMYDRVVVQMEAEKNIYDLHELLAFLELDSSLHSSTQEDMERLKMGHLFRTFYPREALSLERSETFFDLPIDQLKIKILEEAPGMQDIFDTYLEQMTPGEILPGRLRYRIHGLAKKAYELGARSLTAAITGAYSNEEGYKRIASILRLGLLSTEMRRKIGSDASGASSQTDFFSGGADSVFTQMVTERNCLEQLPFSEMNYNSDIRLLISLDALEMGSYQYFEDGFGNRKVEPNYYWGTSYADRPGILEFIDQLQNDSDSFDPGHEVMLKERLDPSLIQKIVVSNPEVQSGLIRYLEECKLVEIDSEQRRSILGKPLDQFIVVADHISEELFIST